MFKKVDQTVAQLWKESTLPALEDFVRLPAKSPAFDADWEAHGVLLDACRKAARWGQTLFPQATFDVLTAPGITPCLFFDIPAFGTDASEASVLCYGHLDKQPENSGWTGNSAPFKPVVEDGKLYGRGCADDGYCVYSALTAVKALEVNAVSHPRICGLIETGEESGSPDLSYWLRMTAPRMNNTALILVLDSTAGDYERLWITSSFRGTVGVTLRVKVLNHGVHSGSASGIVPESFMIIRELLDRLENSRTGEILLPEFHCRIPENRKEQIRAVADLIGGDLCSHFPWAGQTAMRYDSAAENILEQTWKPQLAVIGAEGLPELQHAGNVLRSETALRLSIRIPPYTEPQAALDAMRAKLTSDVPFNAQASLEDASIAKGWDAPQEAPWLTRAVESIGREVFGKTSAYIPEGGSIPILNLFAQTFPQAQFVVTGVLGPHSNAHGPDEMLDLSYAEKLTCAVARFAVAAGSR